MTADDIWDLAALQGSTEGRGADEAMALGKKAAEKFQENELPPAGRAQDDFVTEGNIYVSIYHGHPLL
jgi:hypothetical protein